MIHPTLVFLVVATLGGSANGRTLVGDTRSVSESSLATCQRIASSVSSESEVYYPGTDNYLEDTEHWATSSSQMSTCSFEPGTVEDVGIALQILGETRTPFAVKGGGHATNPGFSSTEGVHIAMSRFSDVVYDRAAQTATIGMGLIWDNVYAALDPHGVNVVGGRVSGVGVAGFTLGGGYSWLTSQYGLTVDTVQTFELVMPNGTAINVTETSSPDLFFALKGGQNNFGIVTRSTLKVFSQTQVWGGVILFPDVFDNPEVLDKISQATANFGANNKDPKAAIISSYNYLLGQLKPTVIIFYDAPGKPEGIFDEFLGFALSIDNLVTRSFPDFVQSIPQYATIQGLHRAVFNSFSVTNYPLSFLQQIADEASYRALELTGAAAFINYDVEPFLPNILDHNTSPSAYPPDRIRALVPLEIYFAWDLSLFDERVFNAIRATVERLQAYAIENGLSDADAYAYPNYAIFGTPLEKMYGANLPKLQAIKKAVDPENVMGLAGGFKF